MRRVLFLACALLFVGLVYQIFSLSEENEIQAEQLQEVTLQKKNIQNNVELLIKEELGDYLENPLSSRCLEGDELLEKIFLLFMSKLKFKRGDRLAKGQAVDKAACQAKVTTISSAPTGPVVIVDPYKEKTAPIQKSPPPKVENKKVETTGITRKDARAVERSLKDERVSSIVDDDIFNQMWHRDQVFFQNKDKLHHTHPNMFLNYLKEWDLYVVLEKKMSKAKLVLKNVKDQKHFVDFSLDSTEEGQSLIFLDERFEVFHPKSHSNGPTGTCRGLVLYGERLQVFLMQTRNYSSAPYLLGKVFDTQTKRELASLVAIEKPKKLKFLYNRRM